MALADALQIKPGVLEVLLVDLPELQDVDLGLEGNLHGRGLSVVSSVLGPHAAIDTSPAGNSTGE